MNVTQTYNQPTATGTKPTVLVVRREVIAYFALALLALVLRVAQLDVVPLSSAEARQALAAWRAVFPYAAGTVIVPESPLLYMLHALMFSTLGPSEFSARILTSLAGVALMLSPLLFRSLLGQTRSFIACVLLFFSPIMLATARMDTPVVWTMLAVVGFLWALWRYTQDRKRFHAVFAVVLLMAMILLTDPTGMFVALSLGLAGLFTVWFRADDTLSLEESPSPIRSAIANFPLRTAALTALLVFFLISTWFMLNPDGLSGVGGLLAAGLNGIATPRPYTPAFFPFLTTVFYEPFILLLGLAVALHLFRTDEPVSAVDRFLLGWVIFAVILSLVYAAAGPEHALSQ